MIADETDAQGMYELQRRLTGWTSERRIPVRKPDRVWTLFVLILGSLVCASLTAAIVALAWVGSHFSGWPLSGGNN